MLDSRKVCATAVGSFLLLALFSGVGTSWAADETAPARDPKQAIDEAYTAKIQNYTTAPYFTSPLVNYLPASKNVPTPEALLGDFTAAPLDLPYAQHPNKYTRML